MDRCRCEEYKEAVKKLKFYTVGTFRPELIENYDRGDIAVAWIKIGISYDDMKFSKPKARRILKPHELPENRISKEARSIEQMWCPFMTPYYIKVPQDDQDPGH